MHDGANKRDWMLPPDSTAGRIASLCDMHGLRFGSADALGAFITALNENKHFAMDFWALVAKRSNPESTPRTNDSMLDAIVKGVTGYSAAELTKHGGEHEQQIKDLASLLAGEDVQRPANLTAWDAPTKNGRVATAPRPGVGPRTMGTMDRYVSRAATSLPRRLKFAASEIAAPLTPVQNAQESVGSQIVSERETASEPEFVAVAEPQLTAEPDPPVPVVEPQPELVQQAQTVAAVEPQPVLPQNAEAVETKPVEVTPIEMKPAFTQPEVPGVADLSSQNVPLADSVVSAPVAAARTEPQLKPLPGPRDPKRSRLVLEPERVRTYDQLFQASHPPIRVPLGGYRESGTNSRAVVITILALVLVGGGAYFARRYVETEAATPVSRVLAERESVAPAKTEESYAPGSNAKQDTKTKQYNPFGQDAPTREAAANVDVDGGSDGDDASGPLKVFPAVMEDYLQSSRVPVYPEAARASQVEGRVVMQAVITQDGSVGHLHVLEGDAALRNAATEAVSKWRYRPYMVDGKPVEVTTTVTVNFRLNQ